MISSATPHAGVMTGGQPEPSGLACAASLKAAKEKQMTKKKARFIADSVRVTPSQFSDSIFIEVRQARVADPVVACVPIKSVPALIEAIAKAAINVTAGDRAP